MNAHFDELLQPLSARSVIASALLGTHPPRLRGRLLVALAEEFGIGGGTARVALSRMVERGELTNQAGFYELTGSLARRQQRQDLGRDSVGNSGWDGTWEQAIVVESGRAARDRHSLRQALAAARLGQAREGVWMRPANLDRIASMAVPPKLSSHVLWFTVGECDADVATVMTGQLFDLEAWTSVANALVGQMRTVPSGLAERFRLAAAVLQHLTRDPLLPAQLYPRGWPTDDLRGAYHLYESALQAELSVFFAAAS